jgi:hypothetical protein
MVIFYSYVSLPDGNQWDGFEDKQNISQSRVRSSMVSRARYPLEGSSKKYCQVDHHSKYFQVVLDGISQRTHMI